jgi:hypothetical protein
MNNLVEDVLKILHQHALVKTTRVVYFDETPLRKVEFKVRCSLQKNLQLQIWIHNEPGSLDYAYQLFSAIPLLRWDNAPHYEHLSSAPHHFHAEDGSISTSPLAGNVKKDLKIILKAIIVWMEKVDQQNRKVFP